MSIFYITGKPRGGKSYLAVEAIYKELCDPKSQRFVVTNIALNFEHIAEWLAKDGVKHEVNLRRRVRVLNDEETGEFWCYEPHFEFKNRKTIKVNRRGTEIEVPDFTYEDGSARGDSTKDNPGTFYVIDEVHIFFPSRAWQRTGEDCTYFLSQHGKLKCDVCMVTQHVDQCDKALRRLAQEYMTVRNLSREPIMGFRLGSLFRFNRMLNSPTSANPYVFESGFKTMNFEKFGSMYDTSAGVGITGSMVPNVEKKGRSLWWLAIPVAGFVMFWFNFTKIAHGFQHSVSAALLKAVPGMQMKMAGAMNIPGSAIASPGPAGFDASGIPAMSGQGPFNQNLAGDIVARIIATNAPPKVETLPFWNLSGASNVIVSGWARSPSGWKILLSNGQTIPGVAVQQVNDYYVELRDGTRLRMADWSDVEKLQADKRPGLDSQMQGQLPVTGGSPVRYPALNEVMSLTAGRSDGSGASPGLPSAPPPASR